MPVHAPRCCTAPFFPVAGAVLAISNLGALSQAEFRDRGTTEPSGAKMTIELA
jgi:hypothetical protein